MLKMMMTLEVKESCTVQHEDGRITRWKAGQRRTLSLKQARQVAQSVGRKKIQVLHGHTRDLHGVKDDMSSTQLGDRIAWQGPDTFMAIGEVEGLHVDVEGIIWAFVAVLDGTWAVVNLQCAQRIDEDA